MRLSLATKARADVGLAISHDCWHGSYRSFRLWRGNLARAAGLPPLDSMRGCGFGGTVSWETLPSPEEDALIVLLHHSDCDGEIASRDASRLADRLESLLPEIDADWRRRTMKFVDGLREAASLGEDVEFR